MNTTTAAAIPLRTNGTPPGRPCYVPGPARRASTITIGELRRALADLPDHAPVLIVVPGWDGIEELPLTLAEWDGALVLETEYSHPGEGDDEDRGAKDTPASPAPRPTAGDSAHCAAPAR